MSKLMRWCLAALGTFACALAGASGANAAVVNDNPTILGPSGSVAHTAGGYGGSFDLATAQGITAPELNAARWDVPLTPGPYLVEAWIPKEAGVTYARYMITHAGVTSEVRLHQVDFGNVWVSLGTYTFDASQSSVRATDAAGSPGDQLAWDAIRWTPVSSVPPNVQSDGTTTIVDDPQVSGPEENVTRFVGIGQRDDLLRTYAQGADATVVNSATWSAPVPAGTYDVATYVPREHAEADVAYTVRATTGNVTIPVAQSSYSDVWVPLGRFTFGATGAVITSSDSTGKLGQEIAWDAVRLQRVSTPAAPPQAPPTPPSPPAPTPAPEGGGNGITTPAPPPEFRGESDPPSPPPEPQKRVAAQRRDLLSFLPVQVIRPGRTSGPRDGYLLSKVNRSSTSIRVAFSCSPCLVLKRRPKFATNGRPMTRPLKNGISNSRLRETILYKGSVLHAVLSQKNRASRTYTFRLKGRRDLSCTVGGSTKGPACP